MRKLLCFISFLSLSACAFGPLVSHETARTVGDGNHELNGGYGVGGYAFKWNYGATKNLDLGLQWESLSIGIRAKYAFVQAEQGWSWAGALGTGTSLGGSHTYGDVIGSYKTGQWEPYGTLRIVHVTTDPIEARDKDTGTLDFTIDASEYSYGQVIFGTRYWFNQHWALSMEASSLFGISSGFEFNNGALMGLAVAYRF